MGKPILYEKVCYVQEWFRLERMLFPCLILQMGHTGRSQCSDHFAIMEEMGRSHCNLQTISLFPIKKVVGAPGRTAQRPSLSAKLCPLFETSMFQ